MNKRGTGSLKRLKMLVKTPPYRPRLHHKSAQLDIPLVNGKTATRRVTIIDAGGRVAVYRFILSKDAETGCWMTDALRVAESDEAGAPQNLGR